MARNRNCAVYLLDRTPRRSLGWKSPYEVFHTYLTGKRTKPQLAHLKAYGCRAYAMTENAQLKKDRLKKLDPRAEIGYLVGYDSTNIYRIWIPHTGKVISTRDVIFDETKFFDGNRTDLSAELVDELNTLIQKIELPESQAINEGILEDDDEIFEPASIDEDDSDDEPIQDLNDKEDLEIEKAIHEAYLTPPPSEEDDDSPCAFHVQYPLDNPDTEGETPSSNEPDNEIRVLVGHGTGSSCRVFRCCSSSSYDLRGRVYVHLCTVHTGVRLGTWYVRTTHTGNSLFLKEYRAGRKGNRRGNKRKSARGSPGPRTVCPSNKLVQTAVQTVNLNPV